jgi:hypothetical protein
MSTELSVVLWDQGKYEFQRKLGNFIQYFQVNLPTNAYGIPLKLINALPIAENMLDCETTDDLPESIVEEATMEVDIEEGLPIVEGLPLWERFDGELVEYYKLFKQYRDMLYSSGSRAISKLSSETNITGKNLSALAKVYHWQLRCKAFDAFKHMEAQRIRQFRIEKLESQHSKVSSTLLEQSLTYLEEHPEQLNPKVALQMLQLAIKTGRLSLGLNPDKPESESPGGTNINIQQTAVVGGSGMTAENDGSGGTPAPDMSYLQSIVHILDKSGALDKAKQTVIDADFEEVE